MEQFIKELQELMKKHGIFHISAECKNEIDTYFVFYKNDSSKIAYYTLGDIDINEPIELLNNR